MVSPLSDFFYIITAPKYVRKSAGVRTLHHFCHDLNRRGQRAYIALYPQFLFDDSRESVSPELNTPLINQKLLDELLAQGLTPIMLYAEVIRGNPLKAPIVVRYVMNYPGLLGGDFHYPPEEIVYVYSKRLARDVGVGDERIIFMPVSDAKFFAPPPADTKRSGSCFYAAKYQHHHGAKLLPITDNSIQITRDMPDSQTREQIRELFQTCELFYAYEDTALILEAGLCGCPSVLIPNEFFKEALGLDDVGNDGIAWGTSPEEVARAKTTISKMRGNYEALYERYYRQLDHFIQETQSLAAARGKVANTIILPSHSKRGVQTLTFALGYIKRNGLRHFMFKMKYFIRKNGLTNILRNTIRNSVSGAASRQP